MTLRWLAAGALAALLAACGQKGNLRLPDEGSQTVPAPATAPAPGDAAGSDREKEESARPQQ